MRCVYSTAVLLGLSILMVSVSGCGSFTITPRPDGVSMNGPARELERKLSECGGNDAHECTRRTACSMAFPAPGQPTSITYRSIAGFESLEVIVNETGVVEQVRRYEHASAGTMEATSDVC